MYLVLKNFAAVPGSRENFAASPCSDKYFPKRAGRLGTINGSPVEFKVTSSGSYATAATSGNNAYFRFEGKTYWILFNSGVDAKSIALDFDAKDGTSPEKNPERLPAAPAKEAERRSNLGAALRAKFSGESAKSALQTLADALAPNADYFAPEEITGNESVTENS
jgi:hypothetical protein